MAKPKSLQRPAEIPFQQVLDAYLDADTPFPPRYLYRLSDLSRADLEMLVPVWHQAPTWRRQALIEDIESLGVADTLLSFESVSQLALKDTEASVRLPAVRVLAEYENSSLATQFMALLESDPDNEVRAAAAAALGYYVYLGEVDELDSQKKDDIEASLLKAYHGNHADLIRRRALESLGYTSLEAVQPLIQQAYMSENREWKASALLAMGRSASENWISQVLESLDSRPPPGPHRSSPRCRRIGSPHCRAAPAGVSRRPGRKCNDRRNLVALAIGRRRGGQCSDKGAQASHRR